MKKEITWNTSDGRKVVVTAELKTERVIGRDYLVGEIKKACCEIIYSATVAGKKLNTIGGIDKIKPQKVGAVTIVAALGPLGISQDNYDRIQSAIEEIKGSDYWVAWQRKVAEGERVEREYDEHVARVNEMMGE